MIDNLKVFSFIADKKGARLDKYVCEKCSELSRAQAQKLIADGYITVNNHIAKAGLRLDVGDKVNINTSHLMFDISLFSIFDYGDTNDNFVNDYANISAKLKKWSTFPLWNVQVKKIPIE